MHRWFFVFAAVVAALALVLVFTFVRTGATQNTQAKPEVTTPSR